MNIYDYPVWAYLTVTLGVVVIGTVACAVLIFLHDFLKGFFRKKKFNSKPGGAQCQNCEYEVTHGKRARWHNCFLHQSPKTWHRNK